MRRAFNIPILPDSLFKAVHDFCTTYVKILPASTRDLIPKPLLHF